MTHFTKAYNNLNNYAHDSLVFIFYFIYVVISLDDEY